MISSVAYTSGGLSTCITRYMYNVSVMLNRTIRMERLVCEQTLKVEAYTRGRGTYTVVHCFYTRICLYCTMYIYTVYMYMYLLLD